MVFILSKKILKHLPQSWYQGYILFFQVYSEKALWKCQYEKNTLFANICMIYHLKVIGQPNSILLVFLQFVSCTYFIDLLWHSKIEKKVLNFYNYWLILSFPADG